MFMLNWNREEKQARSWGGLPHIWRALFCGTDTSLIELEPGLGKSSATKGGILPQTTPKRTKEWIKSLTSNLKKSLDCPGSYGIRTPLTPADINPGDLESRGSLGQPLDTDRPSRAPCPGPDVHKHRNAGGCVNQIGRAHV